MRPNRYPYTKSQWEEKTTTVYEPDEPAIFKELKSNNGMIIFDGRTFKLKAGHNEALSVSTEPMNAQKNKREMRKMSDSVFIYAFTRYGWVEECIDIDEVAYVDFEKSQICLKAHDARIPRMIQTSSGDLYNVEKALLRNRR